MYYIIENSKQNEPEKDLFIDNIRNLDYLVEYDTMSYDKLSHKLNSNTKSRYSEAIPVGTIPFVSLWLKTFHNKNMTPIEVPPILRTEEFLKRDYKVITKDQIPKTGRYFLKCVDGLKTGSIIGRMDNIDVFDLSNKNLFVLSEYIPITTEYRVYVVDNEIANICCYCGYVGLYPDYALITKAVQLLKQSGDMPKSYTLDVGVNNNGTFVLEVHAFASIGIYTTLINDLPFAYSQGIDWYIHNNYNIKG